MRYSEEVRGNPRPFFYYNYWHLWPKFTVMARQIDSKENIREGIDSKLSNTMFEGLLAEMVRKGELGQAFNTKTHQLEYYLPKLESKIDWTNLIKVEQ